MKNIAVITPYNYENKVLKLVIWSYEILKQDV